MNRRMQLIRAVALQADAVSAEAEAFGRRAADAISGDAGKRQIKGLENIAISTLKVSDVLDYIKRQTARNENWRKGDFGAGLLKFISKDLRSRCDDAARQLGATEVERQRIYLLLIREFVRQMAAHYAFAPLAAGER